MHIYYSTVPGAKRRTKLVDPELQRVHLSCAWCTTPLAVFLGTWGQRIWSAMTVTAAGSPFLLPAPGTILLAPYCWTLQAFPCCSLTCRLHKKPSVGGLKPSEIQLYKRNPDLIVQADLHYLYKERRAGQGTGHSAFKASRCISFRLQSMFFGIMSLLWMLNM